VNFAQSFKYTTGLSLRSVAAILTGYQHLERNGKVLKLRENHSFQSGKNMLGLKQLFVHSKSAIQSASFRVMKMLYRSKTSRKGFDVKAILSPAVPEGQERLRFVCTVLILRRN
jgi:8-amino-7-oxononanoate synthase